MCGITGIYAFNQIGEFYLLNLVPATNTLISRGPDQQGTVIVGNVGFGHRRLSILDTSIGGKQPMSSSDENYLIIFNGEIYNYKQIRKKLEEKGITFHSSGDTEVLLQAYIHYGEKCVEMLNGFFAFAILNKITKELFIARDRFGIKPLLIYQDDDKFIFASEMKSILAYNIKKEIDFTSLYQYLQLNYIPSPNSIFKNIRKLKPGSYLKIVGKEIVEKSYYSIDYNTLSAEKCTLSYEEQKSKLATLMLESVERRMIADVPLGAFLSGGIDSSVITALASKFTTKLHTFSIGYKDEPFFDETKYAQLVAKKYNTEHTVFSLSNQDLYGNLHQVLDYIDEPFADSSALAVHILSERTKKYVTVALSGDGADELFGGYNKYMAEWKARNGNFATSIVKSMLPIWKMMPKSRNNPVLNKFRQLERFAEGMNMNEKERYYRWCAFVDEKEALSLLSNSSKNEVIKSEYLNRKTNINQFVQKGGTINDILRADIDLVLQSDMLTKVDLMSMANGLEVRVPFLDHNVVNFAFSIPENSKIDGKLKKKIVQDAFRNLLPPEIYNRPKHGFEVPLLKWFRTELRSTIENNLLKDEFIEEQGLFNVDEIRKLKKQLFSSSPGDVHARIWGIIVFQNWYKKYFI